MKRSLLVGTAAVAISIVGAPLAQGTAAQAAPASPLDCTTTVRTDSGASNQVIVGPVNGYGNGQGVTVTQDCWPRSANGSPAWVAQRNAAWQIAAVVRACRTQPEVIQAACWVHLQRLRELQRQAILRDLSR